MFNLKINDKDYEIPSMSEELSLKQGLLIQPLIKDNMTYEDKLHVISKLSEINYIDLKMNGNKEVLNYIYDNLPYFKGDDKIIIPKKFKIKNKFYIMRDINDFNLLEFIDFTNGLIELNDDNNNINDDLIKIMVREVKPQKKYRLLNWLMKTFMFKLKKVNNYKPYYFKYNKENIKPYNPKLNLDLNVLNNLPFLIIKQYLIFYIQLFNEIVNEYPKIYGSNDKADFENMKLHPELFNKNDDDVEDNKLKNPLHIYGVFNLLFDSTNGNKQDIDYWLSKPFREFLEHISYIILKNEIENNGK